MAFTFITTWLPQITPVPISAQEITKPLNLPIIGNTFAMGDEHYLAITEDGILWAWRANYLGQLDDGTTNDSAVPIKIMKNVAIVAATSNFSMAVTNDGTLYTWGATVLGRSGYGTTNFVTSPLKQLENVDCKMVLLVGAATCRPSQ